ncbi:MAG: 50S ribosomal protein L5 [Bdellovibrionales bacterium]|nr:50S ribosomal protein L5 [Bdellovibrionales bacterium]
MSLPRLKEKYLKEIVPKLSQTLGVKNVHAIPKVSKVVVNMGLGQAVADAKVLQSAVEDMASITGQRPVVTKAKKAIANFKLRQGMPIGCMVTLRDVKMYEFMDRLVNVALPRVRDFKGVSNKAFDKDGNYTLGIKEHIIFPEIDFDKVDKILGMNITFVTTAKDKTQAKELLGELGVPFRGR